nr:hypothetical protein [Gemmatimonadota bacterium]
MHLPVSSPDPLLADFVLLEQGGARIWIRRGYEPYAGLLVGRDQRESQVAEGQPRETRIVGGEARECQVAGGEPREIVGWVGGGREPHPIVRLPTDEKVVVRGYRRGGAMRHFL